MAQKFLNCPQIAACRQQVRGKAVAQRMRRGRGGQAKLRAGLFHRQRNQARVQRATAQATKQGFVARQIIGAQRDIACDGLLRGGQGWHLSLIHI